MNEWQELSFEELYMTPSSNGVSKPKRIRGAGFKMINMGELFKYDLIRNPDMELVPLSDKEIEKYKVEPGDLLFARQSLVAEGAGKCSIVLECDPITTFESHLIRVRLDKSLASPIWYYYYFSSPAGNAKTQSIVMQVSAAGIRGSDLARLQVPKPPFAIQRKIASILSAYDDLIENNSRRIKILEEMAQRIYREWFVHFRYPGHENHKLVDSELGKIPEGWVVKKINQLAKDVRRSVHPANLTDEVPYVGLEHIPRKSIALDSWGSSKSVNSTKLRFEKNDILFGKIRPYFHKVVIAPINGVCSTDAIVIVPLEEMYRYVVLTTVSSSEFVNNATQTSQGTKMPRANWNVVGEFSLALPLTSTGMIQKFNDIVESTVSQISTLLFKNINLKKTRDLLLPKLISGKIDVSDMNINTGEESDPAGD